MDQEGDLPKLQAELARINAKKQHLVQTASTIEPNITHDFGLTEEIQEILIRGQEGANSEKSRGPNPETITHRDSEFLRRDKNRKATRGRHYRNPKSTNLWRLTAVHFFG